MHSVEVLSVRPFILVTRRNAIKFHIDAGGGGLQQNMSDVINFGSYRSNVNLASLEARIEFHEFSQERFIIQKISTWHKI
jgi:hypothetical protein